MCAQAGAHRLERPLRYLQYSSWYSIFSNYSIYSIYFKPTSAWGEIYNIDSVLHCSGRGLRCMNPCTIKSTPRSASCIQAFTSRSIHLGLYTQVCSLHQLLHFLDISSSCNTLLYSISEVPQLGEPNPGQKKKEKLIKKNWITKICKMWRRK